MEKIEQPDYVSLSQASRMLGVHTTTVRRWADSGMLPVYFTPGGHRRFAIADLENLRTRNANQNALPADTWATHALEQTRSELRQHDHSPDWINTLAEEERVLWRQISMRLMGIVLRFVNAQDDEESMLIQEAHAIGTDYAAYAQKAQLSLKVALEASLFFRDALVDAAMSMPEHANLSHAASGRLLRRVSQVLNIVQLAVVEGYEQNMQRKE